MYEKARTSRFNVKLNITKDLLKGMVHNRVWSNSMSMSENDINTMVSILEEENPYDFDTVVNVYVIEQQLLIIWEILKKLQVFMKVLVG